MPREKYITVLSLWSFNPFAALLNKDTGRLENKSKSGDTFYLAFDREGKIVLTSARKRTRNTLLPSNEGICNLLTTNEV